MVMKKGISIVVFFLLVTAVFASCSSQKPLLLKKYGPTDIKAGQIFNKQPNGESAIWTQTENATLSTVLVLNGVPLDTAPQQDGTLVTAVVPRALYEKPGEYSLYLLDKKTNQKSNELKVIVNP